MIDRRINTTLMVMAITLPFIISCKKETENIKTIGETNEQPSIQEVTMARVSAMVVEDVTTKGAYTIDGNTATFAWNSDDKFQKIVRGNANDYLYQNYSHIEYGYVEDPGNTAQSAIFEGESVADGNEDTGFALFPTSAAGNGAELTHYGGNNNYDFYLQLGSTLSFDPAHPLKNIVPMMGYLQEDGVTYKFKPLMGVIGVNAINIPATATSITLSTTGGGLSGTSTRFDRGDATGTKNYKTNINGYLGIATNGLRKAWLPGTTKKYTFDAGSLVEAPYGNAATFYFPIAPSNSATTGDTHSPYTNFTITLFAGDFKLCTVTATGLSITVNRSEIVILPTIDFCQAGFSIDVNGTATDIKAYITSKSPSVATVRVAPLTTNTTAALDEAIPNNNSGTLISATERGSSESIGGFTASGAYYIGYKAFNSSGDVIASGILSNQVYYLATTEQTLAISQYKRFADTEHFKSGNMPSLSPASMATNNDDTITIEVSDDVFKGNVMITEIAGLHNDPSKNTHTSVTAWTTDYQSANFVAGQPIYGRILNGSKSVYFYNVNEQVFFTDNGQNPARNYFLSPGKSTIHLELNSNGYMKNTEEKHDLVWWDTNCLLNYNYPTNAYANHMLYFVRFVADKVSN